MKQELKREVVVLCREGGRRPNRRRQTKSVCVGRGAWG